MAYLDIIHFCTDAKKTFRKLKKTATGTGLRPLRDPKLTWTLTVNFALKLFWKDFAGDFEGTLDQFRNHIKNIEKEVGLAYMIEGLDERALARVDRAERDKEGQGELSEYIVNRKISC